MRVRGSRFFPRIRPFVEPDSRLAAHLSMDLFGIDYRRQNTQTGKGELLLFTKICSLFPVMLHKHGGGDHIQDGGAQGSMFSSEHHPHVI